MLDQNAGNLSQHHSWPPRFARVVLIQGSPQLTKLKTLVHAIVNADRSALFVEPEINTNRLLDEVLVSVGDSLDFRQALPVCDFPHNIQNTMICWSVGVLVHKQEDTREFGDDSFVPTVFERDWN